MAKNTHNINATETAFVIEGLRKLALQYDTKVKYAVADEDEETAEQYQQGIADIRTLLVKLGDNRPVRLKSERKVKASKKQKAGVVVVKQSKPKAKAKALATA